MFTYKQIANCGTVINIRNLVKYPHKFLDKKKIQKRRVLLNSILSISYISDTSGICHLSDSLSFFHDLYLGMEGFFSLDRRRRTYGTRLISFTRQNIFAKVLIEVNKNVVTKYINLNKLNLFKGSQGS